MTTGSRAQTYRPTDSPNDVTDFNFRRFCGKAGLTSGYSFIIKASLKNKSVNFSSLKLADKGSKTVQQESNGDTALTLRRNIEGASLCLVDKVQLTTN